MDVSIAFEKETNTEILLYKKMVNCKDSFALDPLPKYKVRRTGSLLVEFLNTDISDLAECGLFISKYCFESYYFRYNPDIDIPIKLIKINLPSEYYYKQLVMISYNVQDFFKYSQNTFLKNLNLPYDSKLLNSPPKPNEYLEKIKEISNVHKDAERYIDKKVEVYKKYIKEHPEEYQKAKEKYQMENENRKINTYMFDNYEISLLIDDLRIDHVLSKYLVAGIPIYKYNITYGFESEDIISILAIEFKEFIMNKHNTIRKCKNCGKYFIPDNLKSTKYCNNIFENGKTCREIGKEKSYKNSLKNDKLLEMYRKRYMSLASSNSHYHTEKTKMRFEKYKSEGAVMKENYLKREISKKEFKKWIERTYL
ncbi:MAG: hypothetical protein IJ220_01350 [Clostridia bacterium]|nr:hypothetical protein [Clostridia bacterium]